MSKIDRRTFFAATAGALAAARGFRGTAAAEAEIPAPPIVPLGKTGVTLSRVGHGTGMHGGNRQSNHTRMGFEKLVKLLRHSYERGVTFFDMADLYGTHVYFREALRSIPREKVAIRDADAVAAVVVPAYREADRFQNLGWRYDGDPKSVPPDFQRRSARATLERFRHEIATDWLDIVLLHCVTAPDWPSELAAYMEALSEAKDRKQVRAVGVSCHGFEALQVAAEHPWVEVILARINPAGVAMDIGDVDKVIAVLRKAKENGKAVIGMKIYGEGRLKDRLEECVRFAQELGLLDAMTVGAERPEEMDETLRLLAKYPVKAGV